MDQGSTFEFWAGWWRSQLGQEEGVLLISRRVFPQWMRLHVQRNRLGQRRRPDLTPGYSLKETSILPLSELT
jgi:hypothetical protein